MTISAAVRRASSQIEFANIDSKTRNSESKVPRFSYLSVNPNTEQDIIKSDVAKRSNNDSHLAMPNTQKVEKRTHSSALKTFLDNGNILDFGDDSDSVLDFSAALTKKEAASEPEDSKQNAEVKDHKRKSVKEISRSFSNVASPQPDVSKTRAQESPKSDKDGEPQKSARKSLKDGEPQKSARKSVKELSQNFSAPSPSNSKPPLKKSETQRSPKIFASNSVKRSNSGLPPASPPLLTKSETSPKIFASNNSVKRSTSGLPPASPLLKQQNSFVIEKKVSRERTMDAAARNRIAKACSSHMPRPSQTKTAAVKRGFFAKFFSRSHTPAMENFNISPKEVRKGIAARRVKTHQLTSQQVGGRRHVFPGDSVRSLRQSALRPSIDLNTLNTSAASSSSGMRSKLKKMFARRN